MIFNWQMAAEFKFIKCESVFLNLAFLKRRRGAGVWRATGQGSSLPALR